MSICGWVANDPDPDSDIEPSLEAVELATVQYRVAYEPHRARQLCSLISSRIQAFARRYPQIAMPGGKGLENPFLAISLLAQLEQKIRDMHDWGWLLAG